jgi:hypothetical protein
MRNGRDVMYVCYFNFNVKMFDLVVYTFGSSMVFKVKVKIVKLGIFSYSYESQIEELNGLAVNALGVRSRKLSDVDRESDG